MFAEHSVLQLPSGPTRIWRYVDLPRFLSILEDDALWFSRLDKLDDPFEGLPTKATADLMRSIDRGSSQQETNQHEAGTKRTSKVIRNARNHCYVSCWHASDIESAAMWSLYSQFGEGIALCTTVERFQRSFVAEEPTVYGGLIKYVDYQSHPPSATNVLEWAGLKRASFAHEKEFRGLVVKSSCDEVGISVPIDLHTLVAQVYISPAAPAWYAELVVKLCKRYRIQAEVEQSQLLKSPGYLAEHPDATDDTKKEGGC